MTYILTEGLSLKNFPTTTFHPQAKRAALRHKGDSSWQSCLYIEMTISLMMLSLYCKYIITTLTPTAYVKK